MKIKLNEQDLTFLIKKVITELNGHEDWVEYRRNELIKKQNELEKNEKHRQELRDSIAKKEAQKQLELKAKQEREAELVKKAVQAKKERDANKNISSNSNDDIQQQRKIAKEDVRQNYKHYLDGMISLTQKTGNVSKAYDELFNYNRGYQIDRVRKVDFFKILNPKDFAMLNDIQNNKTITPKTVEPKSKTAWELKPTTVTNKSKNSAQDLGNFSTSRELKNNSAYFNLPDYN